MMIRGLIAGAAMVALAVGGTSEASVYQVDAARSGAAVLGFGAAKGTFENVTGWVAFHPGNIEASEVRFSLPVDGLHVSVAPSVTLVGTRLLNATKGSAITFSSSSVKMTADGLAVTGRLAYGSHSREVTIPVEVLGRDVRGPGAAKAGFRGTFTLDLPSLGLPSGLMGEQIQVKVLLLGVETSETMIPTEETPRS